MGNPFGFYRVWGEDVKAKPNSVPSSTHDPALDQTHASGQAHDLFRAPATGAGPAHRHIHPHPTGDAARENTSAYRTRPTAEQRARRAAGRRPPGGDG